MVRQTYDDTSNLPRKLCKCTETCARYKTWLHTPLSWTPGAIDITLVYHPGGTGFDPNCARRPAIAIAISVFPLGPEDPTHVIITMNRGFVL